MLTKGQITFPKIKNKKSNNGNAITEAELKKKLQEPLGGPNSATIDIGSLIEKNGQSISTVQDLPSLNALRTLKNWRFAYDQTTAKSHTEPSYAAALSGPRAKI